MKKLVECIIIAITLMCVSCSTDSFEKISFTNENVLVSNNKFICFKGDKATRSDHPDDVIIVVHEIPGYEIHSSENEDSNKDEFQTKSVFIKMAPLYLKCTQMSKNERTVGSVDTNVLMAMKI